MAAGNWDQYQALNNGTGQVEWPQGPMTLGKNERATWLEAWVMQESTGASQRTVQRVFGTPMRWNTVGIPPGWIQGTFEAGPALGVALLTSRDSAKKTDDFYWWIDVVEVI
ncbi:hypothetical protein [Taklimakanibacter deserti]|uniref:hypothetical protein n=1 Tax=Taklimakanibacter deserti TaxID=2267839 RepID=UPI000E6544E0